ncbi:MAG: hypothetical protein ABI923_02120 [bacterium]
MIRRNGDRLAACRTYPAGGNAFEKMNLMPDQKFLRIFFGLAACSWMPHWACHYYRLETQSAFVVGSWTFSPLDSSVSLAVYSALVALNLLSISAERYRVTAAALTGIGHLAIGSLHVYRLLQPFRFEIFGYRWTIGASLRETLIVIPFGLLSLFVAITVRAKSVPV